jgi:Tetrapyrrole (Corrin/Porphyrin) Methylases
MTMMKTLTKTQTSMWNEEAGRRPKQGRLIVAGTGITAISQMTSEALSYIRGADVVFYHVNSGVTATQIRELNPNAVDLYEYYGEGKRRRITYVEMAELMLREVRRGLTVVGVFYGHPGYFVHPARRALAIAHMEGHETTMLAAVSAVDCLFSDLRVDPGVFGCQVLMANRLLTSDVILATTCHVVFLQVSAVGDSGFSFSGYKNANPGPFFDKLIECYGEEQESVYYMAAILPGFDPVVTVRNLAVYRSAEVRASIGAGILYLPPRGMTVESLTPLQSFPAGNPYSPFEVGIVAELDNHRTPAEFKLRRASAPLYRAMIELGTNPEARQLYSHSPGEFVARFPDLTVKERKAVQRKSSGAVRAVTTFVGGAPANKSEPA